VESAEFIPLIRRSLTASRPIAAGQTITKDDIAIKRPGTGIAPGDFETVIGMRAFVAIAEDETLTWNKLTRT
jgi:sialic acid synthase SpsE